MYAAGLDVDINTMDQGIFKAGFMRQMTNLSPLLVPLVRIVKLWAYRSNLNDPTDGTLNSYCLTLLAIFHLQQLIVPQLPPIWKLLPASPPQRKRRPSAAQTSGSGESSDAGTSQVSIPNGTAVQQRPLSSHRIMNAMKRPPNDALDEIQRRVSQWRKECAPPATQLPLDSIVLAFYVRFSAFLLARYRRFNDTSWRTVSTWAASLFPCKKQKMKLKEGMKGKGSKGNVHKCMGENNMADDADPVVLLRELLRTLRRHWTKSGGDIRMCNAAVARVLEASALMIPPGGVYTLRKEFPAIEETDVGTSAHSEPITSRDASIGWVDSTTRRQAQMLDSVYKFLLQVPQSSRSNEKAAANKRRANDLLDSSDGSASEAEMSSSEDSDTQGRGYLTAEAANALPGDSATEPALQGAQDKPSDVQQRIVRDKALEAKENDLILDMSSDDDESMHESGASAATAAQQSTSRQVPQTRLSSNTPSSATVFTSAVAGKDTAPDADTGIGPEIVSAPVLGALCSSKDLPPVSALSQALADHGGGSGDNAHQAPPDRAACGGMGRGNLTGACTHPGFQVPVDSADSTQGIQGIRGAPSASVPLPGQQHDTAIAQELYMRTAAELHSNPQSWPEDSPAERVRAVCRQRLAALDCELAVEDPFDECDNAARTLRHFGQLLAHTLLPVLYGTDALECLLRQPPPKADASGAQQHLQDTVRQAYNTMQRYEHPIQTDSDENRKINAQASQWTAQAVGGREKDREGSFFRQLSDSHMQALRHCQKSTKQYQGPHIASGHGPSVTGSNTNGASAHHGHRGAPHNGGNRGRPQGAVHINPNEFPTLAPGGQAPHPGPQHGNAPGPRPWTQQDCEPPHANRHSHNAPAQRPIHGPIQHQDVPQMRYPPSAMQHQTHGRHPPGAVHHHTHPNHPHAPTQVFQHPQGGHGAPQPPRGHPHARSVPIADLFHSSAQQARPAPPHAREPLSQAQYAPRTSTAHLVTSASVDKDAAQKAAHEALGNTPADHHRHGGVRGHGAEEAS